MRPHHRLKAARPAEAAQPHGDRAKPCPYPYLAHTGWQGPSSVCLQSWSPHTRTCLGLTPHCSQSARHLWGHKDRVQAWNVGRRLDSICACADQMLQTSGPQPSASAASRNLSLTCPVVSWLEPRVALLGTILPCPTVPLDPSVPPGALPLPFNSTEYPPCSGQYWSLSVREHPH